MYQGTRRLDVDQDGDLVLDREKTDTSMVIHHACLTQIDQVGLQVSTECPSGSLLSL